MFNAVNATTFNTLGDSKTVSIDDLSISVKLFRGQKITYTFKPLSVSKHGK